MNIDELIEGALRDVPPAMKAMGFPSASIFYSNPWLTLRKGDYYLLGMNPGGSEDIPSQTIDYLRTMDPTRRWSLYLDEANWQSDKMQRNLARLSDAVFPSGQDALRDIFSTNAIFARSSSQSRLNEVAPHLFAECWSWHDQFLAFVRPRTIIAAGNGSPSAFALIGSKLRAKKSLGPDIPVYSTFSIKAVEGELETSSGSLSVRLIGLPTLSRCSVDTRPGAVAEMQARGWLP